MTVNASMLNQTHEGEEVIQEPSTVSSTSQSAENGPDALTMIAQQINGDFTRYVRYREDESIDGELPPSLQRANTVYGFADNGMPALLPVPAAVGAGDLRTERWTNGVDFVAGSTTTVTLSRAYISKANLGTVVMQGVPQDPASYDIIGGNVLQFAAIIPVGVSTIWCVGGTTLSLNTPATQSVGDSKIAPGSKLMSRVLDIVSVRDYGCKLTGIDDDTSALLAALGAIGNRACTLLISGPLLVSQDVGFPPNVILSFINDGAIVGAAGTELIQTQSQTAAGRRHIFRNCVFRSTVPTTLFPEWAGASTANADNKAFIQATIDAIRYTGGVIDFDGGTYAMSGAVTIGTGAGSTGQNAVLRGKGRNLTKINITTGTSGGLQIVGGAGTSLQGIEITDMSWTKSVPVAGGVGIYAQYTALLYMANVSISGFIQGVGALCCGNMIAERVIVILSGAFNHQRGFNLDGGGATPGGNASAVFHRCYVDGSQVDPASTGHIGFYGFGAYVSDLEFSSCETQMPIGIGCMLDASASVNTGNEDVQFINCRFDSVNSYGLYLRGFGQSGSPDSMVTVMGGWINSRSVLAETSSIYLENCRGVSVIGTQLYCAGNAAYGIHVKAINCTNIIVTGCLFSEMKWGVYMVNCGLSTISGNRFYSSQATPATNMIVAAGCSRVMTNGNVYDGYCTNVVVVFDNTSVGCGVTTSSFNSATLTYAPRVSNSSSGPVGGADGSLGLNSGV